MEQSFYIFDIAPVLIIVAIFVVAVLYSSVGHGGASGYLAVMALFAVPQATTRPSALLLNVFVATIGMIQFYRAGYFSWRIFLPFAATSIPFAYIGGTITLPTTAYKIVLGAVLIVAAIRLAWNLKSDAEAEPPKIWVALLIGAVIGLLSGLVGVGGGIFLKVRVEQIERDAADVGLPQLAEDRVLRQVHAHVDRRAVGIRDRLDRKVVEIQLRVRFLLPPVR